MTARSMSEATIFDQTDSQPDDSPPTLVLTSSHTVYPLLSRGCLVPAVLEQDGEEAPPGMLATSLPTSIGSLPSTWVAEAEGSARNLIPLALELKRNRSVRSLSVGEGLVLPLVPLEDVQSILFRKDDELERFKSWSYNDVAQGVREISFLCRPEAFQGVGDNASVRSNSVQASVTQELKNHVRRADMYLGLILGALHASEGSRPEVGGLARLFALDLAAENSSPEWPVMLAARMLAPTEPPARQHAVDVELLRSSLDVIAHYPSRAGWPSKDILAQIVKRAAGDAPTESALDRALEEWSSYCGKALNASVRPQLTDDGSIVRRALLLLLLRGDPEAIENDGQLINTLAVGKEVRKFAQILASARVGMRGLSARVKFADGISPERILRRSAELFARFLAGPVDAGPERLAAPDLMYRVAGDYRGVWEFRIDSELIAAISVDTPPALRKVAEDCRYYGFKVDTFDPYVIHVSEDDATLPGKVQISLLGGVQEKIRFTCRSYNLAGTRGKGSTDRTAGSAMKRTTKQQLMGLLMLNAAEDTHARVAVDPDTFEVVVIVDQLIGTMDRDELIFHVRNVSRMADEIAHAR